MSDRQRHPHAAREARTPYSSSLHAPEDPQKEDFHTFHDRVALLRYLPFTRKTLCVCRSLSSKWRVAAEANPQWRPLVAAAEGEDMAGSHGRKGVVPLFVPHDGRRVILAVSISPVAVAPFLDTYARLAQQRHDALPHLIWPPVPPQLETSNAVLDQLPRDVYLSPRLASGDAMTEQQLYRAIHIIDTVKRARPALQLQVHLDFTNWIPRNPTGATPIGGVSAFSDPDTLAALCPPQLRSIRLAGHLKLPSSCLHTICMGAHQLTSFWVDAPRWFNDDALCAVSRNAPLLQSLVVRQAALLTDVSLQVSSHCLTHLQVLQITEARQVTDVGLCALLRRNKNLRILSLPFCERVTGDTVTTVAAVARKSLTDLDLSGDTLVSPQSLLLLFTENCQLRRLHASFNKGLITIEVLHAMLEYGWTLEHVSAAFSEVIPEDPNNAARVHVIGMVQRLRTRGCDFLC